MTVEVEMTAEALISGDRRLAVRGAFEMVAVDAAARPVPVPSPSVPSRDLRLCVVKQHAVRTYKSAENLPRADQLAWKIAEVATDPVAVEADVVEMIGNRIIDNAAVAAASLTRRPVASARAQALAHSYQPGATVFGLSSTAASRRNGRPGPTAWRCASSTSTTPSSPPIIPIPATTSRRSSPSPSIAGTLDGSALVRGLAAAYEIQVDLVKGICLHEHKIDHIAHLGPSAAAGIGAALELPTETVYQAVQQALHVTTTTRQSRKGEEISSWKAYAPAFTARWRWRRWTG